MEEGSRPPSQDPTGAPRVEGRPEVGGGEGTCRQAGAGPQLGGLRPRAGLSPWGHTLGP